ncbi:hypothetical protein [Natronolimnobius baerhuensis]|uniref:Uncharacterized protein n=1 Tax=Natronolimnobius baerhuensis TaxID=253108 RepID=A0A202E951_9EURY|nr:hypothetical protein [Natronolimnobius baerhuensis]OVE84688.1 hypothetical protein B2G88_09895 [Natronolimnobius baerhuensis]
MPNPSANQPSSFGQQIWIWMFTLSATMLLVLGWAFLHLEPGTASYVISQVTAIILVFTLISTAIVLYSGWKPF